MKATAIFIITCDTNKMTNECLKSLITHIDTKEVDIVVFDNGKTSKFTTDADNIIIFDNTKGRYVDSKKWSNENGFNWGIAIEHMLSVQWMIENLRYNNVILLESDTILKDDITKIIDESYITCGSPEEFNFSLMGYEINFQKTIRIAPYLQYFNLNKIHDYGLQYISKYIGTPFRKKYLMQDRCRQPDTGFFFYYSIKNRNSSNLIKYINYNDYIQHLTSGSWKNKNKYN